MRVPCFTPWLELGQQMGRASHLEPILSICGSCINMLRIKDSHLFSSEIVIDFSEGDGIEET